MSVVIVSDVEGILSAISEHSNSFVIAEQEAEALKQQQMAPQGQPQGPPQPQRPAPIYTTPQKREPKPVQPPRVSNAHYTSLHYLQHVT